MATGRCSCATDGRTIGASKNGEQGRAAPRWCPGCAAVDAKARNIVLFSDGTGNSSGKLFKTNVWRMYEAVDLGPTADDRIREQIAYYDDGVGTSGLKPLALLGGVFGQGLKRNVLDIYKFACRSYKPGDGQVPGEAAHDKGDLIYGFGFSRGAFTMRLAIALIAEQGLVPYENERQLDRQARQAYRTFRRSVALRRRWSPATLVRWAVGGIGQLWRTASKAPEYRKEENWRPVIRFIGVWDTVAAYGGPVTEVTRAVDNWIHPLSMPNYALHPSVQRARHALALDDERDSFRPLLWDEIAERDTIADHGETLPWVDDGRLEQVWFAGMHADVGGGYPDESLSFVSLLWMVEEAQAAGLRTVDVIIERYRALASSLGPMHDSRAGFGSYYRYQPRRIESWLHADEGRRPQTMRTGQASDVASRTAGMRDPTITDPLGRPRGLINEVKVHESVIARVAGRKDYAPFVLPAAFSIVPPGREGEAKPQATSGEAGEEAVSGSPAGEELQDEAAEEAFVSAPISVIDARVRRKLDDRAIASLGSSLEPVWNRVWLRRGTYFVTLAVTLALVSMPLWIDSAPSAPFLTEGRNWLTGPIQSLAAVLPDFLSPLIDTYSLNTFWFGTCLVTILFLRWIGNRLERSLRRLTRRSWSKAIGEQQPGAKADHSATANPAESLDAYSATLPSGGLLARVRNDALYQRAIQLNRWRVLPSLVAAVLLLLLAWMMLILVTQLSLPIFERGAALCPPAEHGAPELDVKTVDFGAHETCRPLDLRVQRNVTYRISFRVSQDWAASGHPASPEGIKAGDLGLLGLAAAPLRRVMQARYLQPILMLRPPADDGFSKNVYIYPLTLRQDVHDPMLYRGDFNVERSGAGYLFANDVVAPFAVRLFDMQGTACITVRRASYDSGPGIVVSTPTCLRVAAAASARESGRRRAVEGGDTRLLFD